MRITMQKAESLTREQMREFLAASEELDFALARRTEIYDLVERTLRRQRYLALTKKDKGVVRRYLAKLSGRSLPQITRLIRQYRQSGAVRVSQPRRRRFPTRYTADDIALLAAVDAAHEGLSGPAVRHILWREYTVYNKAAYQRLASISASHIYNLRRTAAYRQHHVHHTKTRSRGVSIGERRKPDPRGQPGYLRVDTVHQGDTPTRPGLYHINAVDTLTQWQVVGCCETISEAHLIPVLEAILHQFPFLVRGFHSDNGSEFLNHRVEKLLNKLLVGEFTKSRAHRTTDNALVEGKNGAVLRKHIGHEPIAACHAAELQRFYTAEFNSYLNYHRPCGFATVEVGDNGKRRRRYRLQDYRTPYEKLLSLDNWESHLKPGIRAAFLEQQARRMSDTECALRMQQRKRERPETGLSARDSSGMGGGVLARSTTRSPSPHLNPLERSSLPTSVPLPTQTCFRIILELENADKSGAVGLHEPGRARACPPDTAPVKFNSRGWGNAARRGRWFGVLCFRRLGRLEQWASASRGGNALDRLCDRLLLRV